MNRWILWLPLALFVLFIGLAAGGLLKPDDQRHPSRMVGQQLPSFDLPPAATGVPGLTSTGLADGRPRIVNFFASWCLPCAAEAPQLDTLAKEGVRIDGIAVRDARADVDGFLARWGNPYRRIGLDARSQVQLAIGSSGVPESFIVDGKGIIRYQHIGDIRVDDLPLIREKLTEAAR